MSNERIKGLKCENCGKIFPGDGEIQSLCPDCPPHLGTLECLIDYNSVKKSFREYPLKSRRDMSIFRYCDLLPVSDIDLHIPLQIGWTPTYQCPAAAETMEVSQVLVKDDGLNPSASYKDRASAMAVARAVELGYEAICTASTGNAAASLATCARSIHFPCVVFVPESTPEAKLVQMLAFGAKVFKVAGNYDQAFDLACAACDEFGWMNRSAGFNPYLVEGKKTGAWELAEQTGFKLPDAVFVSVGDGSIVSGLCKGFQEMKTLNLIKAVPRVIGVQADGASVLVKSWQRRKESGSSFEIKVENDIHTIADSVSVGNPREGMRALRAVELCNGEFISVSDDEILEAIRRLPMETGVFGEPAAATAYAGAISARKAGLLNKSSSMAVFVTGSGLKDLKTAETAIHSTDDPLPVGDNFLELIQERLQKDEER